MREILSLSFPPSDIRKVKTLTKKRGYDSVIAYVNHLLREDADLISETELLKTVQESRREYKKGKSIKAKSIADLL